MSAAEATAAPITAGPPRARRPSTLTILRWELRKLRSQKRTYLGLGIAVLLPVIFLVAQNLRSHHPHDAENIFASHITESGLATPVLILLWASVFLLPLIAALVAGDVVANEDGNGTLKTILTRSVDRGQVIAAKTVTALIYAAAGAFTMAAVATAGGVASWGFRRVITFSGTVVPAPKGLLLVIAAYAFYLIPLAAVACIGVLLSTVTRNSAAAVVGTLAFTLLLALLTLIPGLEGAGPYLLTTQYQAWQGLLATPTDWGPILHSLWVCALYALPALAIAHLVFLRRDVAGG
jgi:ABC-2 type transport system permease protein